MACLNCQLSVVIILVLLSYDWLSKPPTFEASDEAFPWAPDACFSQNLWVVFNYWQVTKHNRTIKANVALKDCLSTAYRADCQCRCWLDLPMERYWTKSPIWSLFLLLRSKTSPWCRVTWSLSSFNNANSDSFSLIMDRFKVVYHYVYCIFLGLKFGVDLEQITNDCTAFLFCLRKYHNGDAHSWFMTY